MVGIMPRKDLHLKEPEPGTRAYRKRKARGPLRELAREERKSVKGNKTRLAEGVRNGKRSPPVPPGKTIRELRALPAASDEFKVKGPRGTPMGVTPKSQSGKRTDHWREDVREDHQKRLRETRAKVRKADTIVMAREREVRPKLTAKERKLGIDAEQKMIAEGDLSLDEWDDEELMMGFRKNRNGRFGERPKYIPSEITQEVYRRIVKRHQHLMRSALVKATNQLLKLATQGDSEKVQLDAVKLIIDRNLGKIPEKLAGDNDAPWTEFLADSVQQIVVDDDGASSDVEVIDGEVVETPVGYELDLTLDDDDTLPEGDVKAVAPKVGADRARRAAAERSGPDPTRHLQSEKDALIAEDYY